jgi:hypothetical protein
VEATPLLMSSISDFSGMSGFEPRDLQACALHKLSHSSLLSQIILL